MKRITLMLISLVLLGAGTAQAGEATVTKVRGNTLTIDKGSQDGLAVGMEVVVVRPTTQAIIHPVTGENLGSPDIQIAAGQVAKISGRAASVRLGETPLLEARPGDVVRFTTPEEGMVLEQERTTLEQEKATQERQEMRGEISRLAKDIKGIQGNIRSLEEVVKKLDGIDRMVKGQLGRISGEVASLRNDVRALKETVTQNPPVPVTSRSEKSAEQLENDLIVDSLAVTQRLRQRLQAMGMVDSMALNARLEELIKERLGNAPAPVAASVPAPASEVVPAPAHEEAAPPPLPSEEPKVQVQEAAPAGPPFYQQPWFFGAVGGVGLLALAFFLIKKLRSGGSHEDEEEEGEEDEEDEEEEEEDIEAEEEEDDIVVEESN